MNLFLNSVGKKNLKLVKMLISEDRYFSLEELSNELNISDKTVKKLALLLLQDIQKGLYQAEMSIKPRTGIRLTEFPQFFLSEFERVQLGNSISYKIIEEVFYGEYKNAVNFSNKNFTSLSSFYKHLKEIRFMLQAFNVPELISTRAKVQKNEMNYRYFFFHFFWNTFKGEKWPFKNCDRNLLMIYIKKIEKILNRTYSIPEKEILCYWIAIMCNRLSSGFKLSTLKKEERENFIFKGTNVYSILKEKIDSIATIKKFHLNEAEKEAELYFLCIILCGIANHETQIGNRMTLEQISQQNCDQIQKWLNFFMEELQILFNLSLSDTEKNSILIQLHTAHFCWEKFNSGEQFFSSHERGLDLSIKTKLIWLFTQGNKLNLISDDVMYSQEIQIYYEILIVDIVKSRIKKDVKVNIFIMGNLSKIKENIKRIEISEYFRDTIQFTDILSSATDVLLTDYKYMGLVEEYPAYVIASIPSMEKEFILLKSIVNRILDEKNRLII